MILLDTNVIIYAADPAYPSVHRFLTENAIAVSAITYVEALGYHALDPRDRVSLERFFAAIPMLDIDRQVIDGAVALRQQRKLSLGDALIAATALEHRIPLATNNSRDFQWIAGLRLINPLVTN
ncbi:MAG TPA: type II toxin-antitoxin system VapC family toxin [Longimicrobium sp.]